MPAPAPLGQRLAERVAKRTLLPRIKPRVADRVEKLRLSLEHARAQRPLPGPEGSTCERHPLEPTARFHLDSVSSGEPQAVDQGRGPGDLVVTGKGEACRLIHTHCGDLKDAR